MVCSAGRAASHVLLALGLALLLALALLCSGRSAPASQTEETTGASEATEASGDRAAGPAVYPIGVYVTSLHDFDTTEGTFGVDYWVWSVHPPSRDPLENLEFSNSREVDVDLELSEERGETIWSQRKISAVVRHNWDLSDFPFDKQILEIDLEEGAADASDLVYEADRANSGYNEEMALDAWRVTSFDVQERQVNYDTTFGDPDASGGSSYARLNVMIGLERASISGFFDLVAGVYAAVAIALVSFFLTSDIPPIFSGRIIMLVGALFSTVINMQVSQTALGRPEYLTLVDEIHITAMILIFAAALVAVLSRKTSASGKPELAQRRDRVCFVIFGVSFALVNAALILVAAVG